MEWSLVAAVNDDAVLNSCLLESPDVRTAKNVILRRGCSSAAVAYNGAIEVAGTDLLVFAHQDCYFPKGWLHRVEDAIERISKQDPHWGVVGVWGVTDTGRRAGHLYCAGLMELLGEEFDGGKQVRTLDEVVLMMRKSSRLRFDGGMPGFHLYATDACLEAAARGMNCYAISALCIHNTNGYKLLPASFWANYWYLRRKWQTKLPIVTPCTEITYGCWPMIRWNLKTTANLLLGRHRVGRRVADPRTLCPRSE